MDEPSDEDGRRQVIGGRHGSPTITVAFPFAKVESVDTELRAALAQLADVLATLAETAQDDDAGRDMVARSARELAARLRDDG